MNHYILRRAKAFLIHINTLNILKHVIWDYTGQISHYNNVCKLCLVPVYM